MCLNDFNSELYQEKYRIKSIRLSYWDYSSDGWYFVTICTKNMVKHFGDVRNYVMGLSDIGCVVHEQWRKTGELRNNVRLDEFIVMPNHVHGIIQIYNPDPPTNTIIGCNNINSTNVETHCNASLRNNDEWTPNRFGPQRNNLASIIRGFKSSVKRICNKNGHPNFKWQARFYDHIIRNEKSLNEIRGYIYDNPERWELDRNNPEGLWA
ncbi:transposase [Patescibacteria group bacterium]|nr:transposase [Patescibacteria group bacterium]MBU1683009.1 transposase [Patescibacteria group bacterium]